MLTAQYERLGLRPDDKVLDLGCGFGRHAFEAARRGASVVALDAGEDEVLGVAATFAAMVEAGELTSGSLHANVVRGDALHLPFPDATFDRVICSEVLEHIPEDVAAMTELTRVLRPGGTMAITVPRFGPEFGELGVVRRVSQRARRAHTYLSPIGARRAPHLDGTGHHRSPLRTRPA